jgi:FlaA1/EpsC-like NDP-sugar epimerase
MTIPEASQLVLQAGAMGSNSEIFVLDMGEPVLVVDLARRMIELAGHTVRDEQNPSGTIAIEFTNLSPGEKLHEELVYKGTLDPTDHDMIRVVIEESPEVEEILTVASKMELAIGQGDIDEVVAAMKQLIDGFEPSWESKGIPVVQAPFNDHDEHSQPTSTIDQGVEIQ